MTITAVSNHKLICSIGMAIDDTAASTGKNWAEFSNVNINGQTVTTGYMIFEQEHANFPFYQNGKVEINVDK